MGAQSVARPIELKSINCIIMRSRGRLTVWTMTGVASPDWRLLSTSLIEDRNQHTCIRLSDPVTIGSGREEYFILSFLDPTSMTNTQRKRLIGKEDEMDKDVLGNYEASEIAIKSSPGIKLRPKYVLEGFITLFNVDLHNSQSEQLCYCVMREKNHSIKIKKNERFVLYMA